MFEWFTEFVSSSPLTYLVVVGAVALDAVFPLVPGETVVISAAVLAVDGDLWLWLLVPAAALGGFLGDNVSYWAGRKLGEPAAGRLFRGEKGAQKLEWGKDVVSRHGSILIVAARFIPAGRTATTFAAGTLQMDWRRFAIADAVASTLWAVYVTLLGFFGGEAFKESTWKALLVALGVAGGIALAVEAGRRLAGTWSLDLPDRSKLVPLARRWARVMVRCFSAHDILTYASAVAFQLLVAVIPLALLAFVLAGYFGLESVWIEQLAPQLQDRLTGTTFIAIDEVARDILTSPKILWLVAALLLTIWEVSGSIRAVMGALNRIYETEDDRPLVLRFALSFALAIAVAVLVLTAIVVAAFGPDAAPAGAPTIAVLVLRWGVAALLLGAAITLLLRYAPARPEPVRWISVGSVLVVAVWILATLGFGYYVGSVANLETAFGTVTVGITLTGYLYTSSIIFLVGAQIDTLLRQEAAPRRQTQLARLAA